MRPGYHNALGRCMDRVLIACVKPGVTVASTLGFSLLTSDGDKRKPEAVALHSRERCTSETV
jgi:hypothetical protein